MSRPLVVAGGTGAAGRFVVAAALDSGWRVVVPTRGAEAPASFRRVVDVAAPGLTLLTGFDWNAPDALREQGPVDAVLALGGWDEGAPLAEIDLGHVREVLERNLLSHVAALRALAPVLGGGVAVALNGIAGARGIAGCAPVCAAGHAQSGLYATFADERPDVVVGELAVLAPVETLPGEAEVTSPPVRGRTLGAAVVEAIATRQPRRTLYPD